MTTHTKNPKTDSFTYHFETSKSAEEMCKLLLDVRQWWVGFYEETITGESKKLNDEFTFLAGNGMHFTRMKLITLEPSSRIEWIVTESKLTFLSDPEEWIDTTISFDIKSKGSKTEVTFTHRGLVPQIECYNNCSTAWTEYLNAFKKIVNEPITA
jgi:hypothetical protein